MQLKANVTLWLASACDILAINADLWATKATILIANRFCAVAATCLQPKWLQGRRPLRTSLRPTPLLWSQAVA